MGGPVTHLFAITDDSLVCISDSGIAIRSLSTGKTVVEANEEGIRTAAVSDDKKYVATVDEKKVLRVWSLEGEGEWESLSARELPKKPTCVRFTHDTTRIVISDKFGDVFRYPLHPTSLPPLPLPTEKKENDRRPSNSLISHPSKSEGVLVLGHTSLLTDFLLVKEGFIVTADRDEHVRVSWFPEGYNIESFCLGSTSFVSKVHLLKSNPALLVSGGGEEVLRVWEWKVGKQVGSVGIGKWEEYLDVYPSTKMRKGEEEGEKKKVLVLDTLHSFVQDGEEILVFTFVGGRVLCTCKITPDATPTFLEFDSPIITWSFLPSLSSSVIVSLHSGAILTTSYDTTTCAFTSPSPSSLSSLPPSPIDEKSLPYYFEKLDSHPKSIYELMDSGIFEDDQEDKKTKKREGRMKKKAQVLERMQSVQEEEGRELKKRKESEE